MAFNKEKKKEIIENLKEKINQQKIMIFVNCTGLKAKDLFELRKRLKKFNSQLLVVKKSLASIALRDYPNEKMKDLAQKIKEIKGELAFVFGFQDEIQSAKKIFEFSQENQNLKILGGFFENKFRLSDEIIALAQLPAKEELLAKLIGSLSTPISNFINVLKINIKGLLYVLANAKTLKSSN